MKYWKCTFDSQVSKHPEKKKTVVLAVENKQKGKAQLEAIELIKTDRFEGVNGEFFKKPFMEEINSVDFLAMQATDEDPEEDFDFSDDEDLIEDGEVTEEEAFTVEDVEMFCFAICLFGRKDDYSDDELAKIEAAMGGDVTGEELSSIQLAIQLSVECIGDKLPNYSMEEITDVIAIIDSTALKSKGHIDQCRESGCRKANEFNLAHNRKNIEAAINSTGKQEVKEPEEARQETAKIPVNTPFEVFVRVISDSGKFKSSFMARTEGKKTQGDLDSVFDKEFDQKENAITLAIGKATDWFMAIGANEGHLQDAANNVVASLGKWGSDTEKMLSRFDACLISGGIVDADSICEVETGDEDLEEDFDFSDDDFDFSDGDDEENETETEKDSDIEDQTDIEDTPETKIERPDDSVLDANLAKIKAHGKEKRTLAEINKTVNDLKNKKKGEQFFIAYGLDDITYRRSDGMSNSELKIFNKDPGGLEWSKNCPQDEDKMQSLNLGRAVHTKWLEPELYDSTYLIKPAVGNMPTAANIATYDQWIKDGRSDEKKGRPTDLTIEKMDLLYAFDAEVKESGATVLTEDDQKKVKLMTGSVKAHPTANYLLESIVSTEVSIWWIDEKTGVLCKCRVDAIAEVDGVTFFVDVKTSGDFDNFGKSIINFGYHRQDAHYSNAGRAAFGEEINFLFIVVSSSIMCGKYPVKVSEIPTDIKALGIDGINADLKDYAERKKSGNFVKIIQEEIPAYMLRK